MARAIVEARAYEDAAGRKRLLLATLSDLTVEAQVTANGATWLDRQLLAREPATSGGGFGGEVRDAMDRRIDHLSADGLARRPRAAGRGRSRSHQPPAAAGAPNPPP